MFSFELLLTSFYYLQLPTRHLGSWTYFAKIVTVELLFPLTPKKKKKKTMHFYIHNNLNVVCKMKNKRVSKKKKLVL